MVKRTFNLPLSAMSGLGFLDSRIDHAAIVLNVRRFRSMIATVIDIAVIIVQIRPALIASDSAFVLIDAVIRFRLITFWRFGMITASSCFG